MCGHGFSFQIGIMVCLGFAGWDVADGIKQAAVIEPVHPFEGSLFHGLEAAPWAASADKFSLDEAVDRFGQCVVIAVAKTADGWFDACFGRPFGVFDRQILVAAITVVVSH